MQIPPLLAPPPDGFQGAVFAGAAKANLKPSKLLVSGMRGAVGDFWIFHVQGSVKKMGPSKMLGKLLRKHWIGKMPEAHQWF